MGRLEVKQGGVGGNVLAQVPRYLGYLVLQQVRLDIKEGVDRDNTQAEQCGDHSALPRTYGSCCEDDLWPWDFISVSYGLG